MVRRCLPDWHFADYPIEFWPYLENATVYDSSCSLEARVVFIDKDGGYFLKCAEKGTLATEAQMTRYFAEKGLTQAVEQYLSADSDWLLTRRVAGEDCTAKEYLGSPEKLCDTIAEILRTLHETPFDGCPVPDRTATYLRTVEDNYKKGMFDPAYLEGASVANRDEAYRYIQQRKHLLKDKVLLHGDYCLPNILLKDFRFSGFIDLGGGGVGDRHIDLFWGAWTLRYNLKTDAYRDRFFDAYGRDLVDEEILRLISVIETFG